MNRDYSKLEPEEIELIVKDGLKSEFWKWFTATFDEDQKLILDRIVDLKLTDWNDVVKVVNLIASYKTRSEMVNSPLAFLRDMEMRRQLNQSSPSETD